jgi:hypothetical protein
MRTACNGRVHAALAHRLRSLVLHVNDHNLVESVVQSHDRVDELVDRHTTRWMQDRGVTKAVGQGMTKARTGKRRPSDPPTGKEGDRARTLTVDEDSPGCAVGGADWMVAQVGWCWQEGDRP